MKKIPPWDDPNVEWVCENHPTKEQEHRLFPWFWLRCGGAGMPNYKYNKINNMPEYSIRIILENNDLSDKRPSVEKQTVVTGEGADEIESILQELISKFEKQ